MISKQTSSVSSVLLSANRILKKANNARASGKYQNGMQSAVVITKDILVSLS